MSRRSVSKRGVLAGIGGIVLAATGGGIISAPAFGSAVTSTPGSFKEVSFLGYRTWIPASWNVIDLGSAPNACVRFDRHAVYLGTPGSAETCPAHLIAAKTESLLIEPLSARGAASAAVADPVAHEYVVIDRAAGVKITAAYGANQALIKTILADASRSPLSPGMRPKGGAMAAPVGASAPPVLASAPPVLASPPPVLASPPPVLASPPPVLASAPPVLASAPPAQASAPPAQASAPPSGVSAFPLPPVVATVPPSATNGSGQGFDACTAPSQATMNAWLSRSPYRAVGVYVGGADRACAQPNLTPAWVSQQVAAGWHLIPLYVGPQAEYRELTVPVSQGTNAAYDAASQARSLGLGPGTLVYYDMEAYPAKQAEAALTFLAAWTNELHRQGYESGVYSSSASGVTDLAAHYTTYAMPDVIFDGLWNGAANTSDPAIPPGDWAYHQRVHQYSGGVNQRYGGYTLNIDRDYLDVTLLPTGAIRAAAFGLLIR
jgi:Rv2525c-like, glycoside hydrolase-like domain